MRGREREGVGVMVAGELEVSERESGGDGDG